MAYSAIYWRGAQRQLRRKLNKARVGIVNTASDRYVAGHGLAEALAEEARYARVGYLTTVGYWNGRGDSPDAVAAETKGCAEALREGSEVSVKFVPFGGDRPALDELMGICERRQLTLHFDALQPDAAVDTLATTLRLSERWSGKVGCTLPGRWTRSVDDARGLAGSGVRVRIVKGEIEDPRRGEAEMSEGFLAIADALAGGNCHVEVATHDSHLAEGALRALLAAGTSCEQQVLHSMHSSAAIRVAHRLDVPVRIYVPYGTGRLPYTKETLRHHPTQTFSFARDLLPLPTRRPAIWTAHTMPFLDQIPF
jgi:proline dehydrogenase